MNAIPPRKLPTGIHFGVDMEHYLGDCCAGPSVSASTLFKLHETCPARAIATHYLSPWGQQDEEDTGATALGTLAHTLILEGDAVFADRYAVKPEDMTFSTREGKAWRAEAEASGKEIVRAVDVEMARSFRDAIMAHPAARNAFTGGAPEVTAVTQDAETGIWLKARPDYLRKGLAINLKTADDASEAGWTRKNAVKFGYHVSAALCVDVLRDLGERAHYAFVIVEKKQPYCVAVRVLDDAFMEAGRIIYRRALATFAECLSAGKWTGYGDEVSTVPIPGWLDRQLTISE